MSKDYVIEKDGYYIDYLTMKEILEIIKTYRYERNSYIDRYNKFLVKSRINVNALSNEVTKLKEKQKNNKRITFGFFGGMSFDGPTFGIGALFPF